jgi:hypothetical protein
MQILTSVVNKTRKKNTRYYISVLKEEIQWLFQKGSYEIHYKSSREIFREILARFCKFCIADH